MNRLLYIDSFRGFGIILMIMGHVGYGELFDKFIRLDSKLTRTTRGTGLGLYIVKGLCEGMNIDINLDCDDEFIMTLKFKDYVV